MLIMTSCAVSPWLVRAAAHPGAQRPAPMVQDNKAAFTKSTFGPQFSTRRRTAPSYGFGTSTRAQANKLFVSQEHTQLATAGSHSPGPGAGYRLHPAVGGAQPDGRRANAPRYSMTTAERFPGQKKVDISPGPGAHAVQSTAMGRQVTGAFKSEPRIGFGTAGREHVRKVFISQEHQKTDLHGMDSPGPAAPYSLPTTLGKQSQGSIKSPPTWVFSSADRKDPIEVMQLTKSAREPGPGTYAIKTSVGGQQVDSKIASQPMPSFGTGKIDTPLYISKEHIKISHFGKASPGPAANYQMGTSTGKQSIARGTPEHRLSATQPSWMFPTASRWAYLEKEARSNSTPGPGAYNI